MIYFYQLKRWIRLDPCRAYQVGILCPKPANSPEGQGTVVKISQIIFFGNARFCGWILPKPPIAVIIQFTVGWSWLSAERKNSPSYPWWVYEPPVRSPEGIHNANIIVALLSLQIQSLDLCSCASCLDGVIVAVYNQCSVWWDVRI